MPKLRLAFALLLVLPFVGTTPALADAASAAVFVRATCLAYVDDLAKLDALAKERGWQSIPTNQALPNQVKSMHAYAVVQGNEHAARRQRVQ